MNKMTLLVIISIILTVDVASQPVSVKLAMLKSGDSVHQFNFRLQVKNNSFKIYTLQDTNIINRGLPVHAFIWPYVEKKENGSYKQIITASNGLPILDPCIDSCCNCIKLLKGQELTLEYNVLQGEVIPKGEYRVSVELLPFKIPPDFVKGQQIVFMSNPVYINIK